MTATESDLAENTALDHSGMISWLPADARMQIQMPVMKPGPKLADEPTYYSQSGEDKHALHTYFWKLHGGVFLEMGALDGVTFSNSKMFSEALGWRGVLIEPNPAMYTKLKDNRPHDVCANAAICSTPTSVHFVLGQANNPNAAFAAAVGGIWEFMTPEYRQQWHPDVEDVNELPLITCMGLTALLQKVGVLHIDFFSLDVEGAELEVLRTLDFKQVHVSVLVLEEDGSHPEKQAQIQELLESHGFELEPRLPGRRLNDWYVHKSFKRSLAREAQSAEA